MRHAKNLQKKSDLEHTDINSGYSETGEDENDANDSGAIAAGSRYDNNDKESSDDDDVPL
jgi:hypothetical protein